MPIQGLSEMATDLSSVLSFDFAPLLTQCAFAAKPFAVGLRRGSALRMLPRTVTYCYT